MRSLNPLCVLDPDSPAVHHEKDVRVHDEILGQKQIGVLLRLLSGFPGNVCHHHQRVVFLCAQSLRFETLPQIRTMAAIISLVYLAGVLAYVFVTTWYRKACVFDPSSNTARHVAVAGEFYQI